MHSMPAGCFGALEGSQPRQTANDHPSTETTSQTTRWARRKRCARNCGRRWRAPTASWPPEAAQTREPGRALRDGLAAQAERAGRL